MTIIPFVIAPFIILGAVAIVFILLLTSLYLVAKHEKGTPFILWLLVIIFFPAVGPIAYLIKHFANPSVRHSGV